jgi:hypothetical protein
MILSFSKDSFKTKILAGTKTTTIREDKRRRWRVRNFVHFWRGNPRNVRANPHEFARGIVKRIDQIEIIPNGVIADGTLDIYVNSRQLRGAEKEALILNDGFENEEEFLEFFSENFVGVLITFECHTKQEGGEP